MTFLQHLNLRQYFKWLCFVFVWVFFFLRSSISPSFWFILICVFHGDFRVCLLSTQPHVLTIIDVISGLFFLLIVPTVCLGICAAVYQWQAVVMTVTSGRI